MPSEEVEALLTNNHIMSGRSIQSYRHLKNQIPSNIEDLITVEVDNKKEKSLPMAAEFQFDNSLELGLPFLVDFSSDKEN